MVSLCSNSLGSNHDGEQNPCLPSDQYIMTAMGGDTNQANKLNPWKFSDCSVEYFRDYIQELYVTLYLFNYYHPLHMCLIGSNAFGEGGKLGF